MIITRLSPTSTSWPPKASPLPTEPLMPTCCPVHSPTEHLETSLDIPLWPVPRPSSQPAPYPPFLLSFLPPPASTLSLGLVGICSLCTTRATAQRGAPPHSHPPLDPQTSGLQSGRLVERAVLKQEMAVAVWAASFWPPVLMVGHRAAPCAAASGKTKAKDCHSRRATERCPQAPAAKANLIPDKIGFTPGHTKDHSLRARGSSLARQGR